MINLTDKVSSTKVIIIGAGPTGLSLAVQLLRYDIDCIILEKNKETTPFSKALVVQARTLEIFDQIGLAQKAIAEGSIAEGLQVFSKGKRKAFINISRMGQGVSPFPFALSLEQSKTEKLLLDYLTEQGGRILWNSSFTRLEQSDDHVDVYFTDAEGAEHKKQAQYLVGCDGAGSLVRHQLGLPFEGSTEPRLFYVADVLLESHLISHERLNMFMIPKGFVLFFPMEGAGHFRIVGVVPDAEAKENTPSFEEIKSQLLAQLLTPVDFKELKWFSTYKVHSRMAAAFQSGHCFIAGDAGHIHTPAGGQGMNTGIQDAYNLAWKLAGVINGSLSAKYLGTYNTERTENARDLLRTTDQFFDIMVGSTVFWNFFRTRIIPSLMRFVPSIGLLNRQIFPLISQTGIAYPRSALTQKSKIGKVHAGDRMPYFVFTNGGDIYSLLNGAPFKLLFFGDEDENKSGQISAESLKISQLSFTEIPEAIFGRDYNFYILLRPDNYISYIGKSMDAIKEFLQLLGKK